jgi:hypothetical protein
MGAQRRVDITRNVLLDQLLINGSGMHLLAGPCGGNHMELKRHFWKPVLRDNSKADHEGLTECISEILGSMTGEERGSGELMGFRARGPRAVIRKHPSSTVA